MTLELDSSTSLPDVQLSLSSSIGVALGSYKPASISARRAACTHIFVERLYGAHECAICHRYSPMGWVYNCIQDEKNSSFREESNENTSIRTDELISQEPKRQPSPNQEMTHKIIGAELSRSEDEKGRTTPTQLSPWIEKAILQGHYTPCQISKMRQQRQKVIDAVAAAERHIQKHPEHSANPPTPLIRVSQRSTKDALRNSSSVDHNVELLEKPRMFPRCQFQVCQTCRPTFRDRAWISFEESLAASAPLPFINFETDPRPFTSQNIISRIGLQVYHSPLSARKLLKRPGFHPLNAVSLSTDGFSRQIPSDLSLLEDLAYQRGEAEIEADNRGIRGRIKRAFLGMWERKNDVSTPRLSRKRRTRHESTDSLVFDADPFGQLNDELLREASVVPLPGHDGMDGLADEAGEIEVEEGIAVTEEGIDLGTADIIMSV